MKQFDMHNKCLDLKDSQSAFRAKHSRKSLIRPFFVVASILVSDFLVFAARRL